LATRLSSIESKLTLYVLTFSILFGVLFSAVQIGVDYRGENQRYLENTADLLSRQSAPAALSLYNYDQRAMQAILESLLLNPAVVAAVIKEDETSFEIRAGLSEGKLNNPSDAAYYLSQQVPLNEPEVYSRAEKPIGHLQIWIDERLTRQGFEQRAILTLLLDVLRNIVLAAVLIWVFRLRLTTPLKRLMSRLMEIDPNKPQKDSLSVEGSLRHSELDDLVRKMNDLLSAMQQEISQRHSAEQTVRQLNEQLEEKVRARTKALNDTNNQLQNSLDELQRTQDLLLQAQRMASMGHLAAGMAHEINNPIAVVYSNIATLSEYLSELINLADQYQSAESQIADRAIASALQDLRASIDLDFVRSDAPDLVRTSRLSLERVRNIVSDLRTFADSNEIRKENVSLDTLMAEAVRELGLDKSETIHVIQLLSQLPAVNCSNEQVRLVFRHILHNAQDAMADGGTIEIAGEAQQDQVSVMIKDTGSGMSEEDLSCAVNPFFSRKEIGEGTGLGLTVAYNIMHNHGGELEIESEQGKGTLVTLRFPR
tara:strand:+ start:27904 stop:29523 length:1620 start_codon:yes stop_codon:yes gene_type:complete